MRSAPSWGRWRPMRRTLIESGLRGLAGRFLAGRRWRALLTALGVTMGVALIAAMTVLGATLESSIAEQLRQGFGSYDVMAGYHDRLMQPVEQQRLAELAAVRYSVGVLWLATTQPETRGVEMEYNYIGIGDFPRGDYAYPVKAGRLPGPAEFVAEERLANSLGLKLGDSLALPFRVGQQPVTLVGLLADQGKSSDSFLFHLTWLQAQMGLEEQVTLQLFGLEGKAKKEQVGAQMSALLPDLDVQLRTELDEVKQNMGGLKPMAIAFGVAGLFASVLLVAGSFNIAVQERVRELALLRAVGATQRQVMRLMLQEAVLLGAGGGAAGIGLGWAAAAALVRVASGSLGVQEHAVAISWLPLLVELGAGVALAVVAAWKPAHAAGGVPPLVAMRPDLSREARADRVGGIAGLLMMALGTGVTALGLLLEEGTGPRALTGAVGGMTIAVGLILALPRILPQVVSGLGWPLRNSSAGLLAGRSVLRHRKRSALTVATLVLGIMLVTSVSTVLGEVAGNSETWVRSQFLGDGQVEINQEGDLGAELPALIAQTPGVRAVTVRYMGVYGYLKEFDFGRADQRWLAEQAKRGTDDTAHARITYLELNAVDPVAMSTVYDFGRIQGRLDGGGVILSEQQAKDRGIRLGDTLVLDVRPDQPAVFRGRVAAGPTPFEVTAIVEHLPFYPSSALVDVRLLPGAPATMIAFTYDPAERDEVKAAVQALLRDPRWGFASLRDLHDALAQDRQAFNQRLAIFGALVTVVMVIGGFSLVNGMVTGLHERQRELATLRAVGATPAQIIRQVLLEAGLLGLAGSLLGLLAAAAFLWGVGVALGLPLTMRYPIGLYIACLVGGPGLAALASILPVSRIARGRVVHLLRTE